MSTKSTISNLVPADRRVKPLAQARGRRLLQARKLARPVLRFPVTVESASGLRLVITDDPVDELIANEILGPNRTLYFAPWTARVPDDLLILDLGSHHGFYAAAALHEYPGSKIICVEPSDDARRALQRNLAVNKLTARARLVPAGLAPEAGVRQLLHTDEGSWGSSLFEEDGAEVLWQESIVVLRLEQILEGAEPHIVKCNAEGAEFALLDQLEELGLRPLHLVLMVHPEFGDGERLHKQLAAMGYRVEDVGKYRPAFHCWRRDHFDASPA